MSFDLVVLSTFFRRRTQTTGDIAHALTSAGYRATGESVALAMLDLQLRLEDGEYPFTIKESGGKWGLIGKSPESEFVLSGGKVPVSEPLDDLDLEVLSVIAFAEGASATKIEAYIRKDPEKAIAKLSRLALIYSVPKNNGKAWLPSPTLCQRFGLRDLSQIPGYDAYKSYLDDDKHKAEALAAAKKSLKESKRRGKRTEGKGGRAGVENRNSSTGEASPSACDFATLPPTI